MAKEADALATMGLDLTDLQKQITVAVANIKSINTAAQSADKGIKGIAASSEIAAKALGGFKTVMNALGVSFGIGALIGFGKELLQFGKEVEDSSKISDLTTDSFQELQGALMHFVSASDASAAIDDVSRSLRDARQGSVDAIDKLGALGVTIDEIVDPATSAKTIIEQLADGYKDATDKTEFLQRASAVFGDDLARKLVPAFQEGGQALSDFGNQVDKVDAATLKASSDGELAMERWGKSIKEWTLYAIGFYDKWIHKLTRAKDAQAGLEIDPKTGRPKGIGAHASSAKVTSSPVVKQNEAQQNVDATVKAKVEAVAKVEQASAKAVEKAHKELAANPANNTPAKSVDTYKEALKNLVPLMGEVQMAESNRTRGIHFQIEAINAESKLLEAQITIAERAGKASDVAALKAQQNAKTLEGLELRARQHDLSPQERRAQQDEQRKHDRSIAAEARREIERSKNQRLHPEANYHSSDTLSPSRHTQDNIDELEGNKPASGGKGYESAMATDERRARQANIDRNKKPDTSATPATTEMNVTTLNVTTLSQK